jgi:hypothetical protein
MRKGVLTFEWVLLITVLVIGVVGGVSAVRDAMISEMGDVVGAFVAVDQSYTVNVSGCGQGNEFHFDDLAPSCTGTGSRTTPSPIDQGEVGYSGL